MLLWQSGKWILESPNTMTPPRYSTPNALLPSSPSPSPWTLDGQRCGGSSAAGAASFEFSLFSL